MNAAPTTRFQHDTVMLQEQGKLVPGTKDKIYYAPLQVS